MIDWQITELDTVDSTNNYAKAHIHTLPHRSAILAREQTAGRGRLGRTFHSAPDLGMYLTAVIKPENHPAAHAIYLTPTAAVAAVRAVERFGVRADIKWVNDLTYQGKKLCGILVEPYFADSRLTAAVIGIGINLTHTESDFPPHLAAACTSLRSCGADEPPSARLLAQALLQKLDAAFSLSPDALYSAYASRLRTLNQAVTVARLAAAGDAGAPSATREARAVALTRDFALTVLYPDGTTENLTSGEVRVTQKNT